MGGCTWTQNVQPRKFCLTSLFTKLKQQPPETGTKQVGETDSEHSVNNAVVLSVYLVFLHRVVEGGALSR